MCKPKKIHSQFHVTVQPRITEGEARAFLAMDSSSSMCRQYLMSIFIQVMPQYIFMFIFYPFFSLIFNQVNF